MPIMNLRELPGVKMISSYRVQWLKMDIVAGVILATLLVPQGMAYAELAGLPVITGLYTTVLCLMGYAIFGPSRILVLGPDSSLGPMIAATIIPIVGSNGDPAKAVALASMLALITGTIMVISGVAKLGFVADLLSKPTQIGYMNGLALTILVGQLPKLFGFSVSANGLISEISACIHGIASGEPIMAAVVTGLVSLVLILVLGRWLPRIPAVLIAVLFSIAISAIFHLSSHGVSLVGTLPKGFPPITLPQFNDLPLLIAGAIGITLVALTDTISTASSFASKTGQEVNGNGEMIGIGAANVAAGFFQGFPVSTSGSRTAVAEQAGSKTQVTGLVGAALIVVMLLFVPGLLRNLPQPTLAAVVIAASLSLANIPAAMRLWRQRRAEFVISITAFLGVALLGVLQGIAVAVILSIVYIFKHAWWPYHTTLGHVPGLRGLHDRKMYMNAEVMQGLEILRFDAPLFFANARTFRDSIRQIVSTHYKLHWIIISSEPVTDIDTTAADMLEDLDRQLNAKGISLVFAELKDPVREKLERYSLIGTLEPRHFFPTLDAAVEAFQHETDAKWKKQRLQNTKEIGI